MAGRVFTAVSQAGAAGLRDSLRVLDRSPSSQA